MEPRDDTARAKETAGSVPPGPESAVDPAPVDGLIQRIAKMSNKLVQDTSVVAQTVAALAQAVPEGFGKLHQTFAMLAKQVATNDVKIDAGLVETRRHLTAEIGVLSEILAGEMMDRAVEQLHLTTVVDIVDDVDAVLKSASPDARDANAFVALRMVRDKLLGGVRALGIEPVPIEPGKTPFDDRQHECDRQDDDPASAALPKDVVTEVLRRGYTMRGRMIRRARIVKRGG